LWYGTTLPTPVVPPGAGRSLTSCKPRDRKAGKTLERRSVDENIPVYNLKAEGREIVLLGTAHISRKSVELVEEVIATVKPDTVCVELCPARYETLTRKKTWMNTDLIKVIREKKAFLLLLNLMLASFQKRIGEKLGIKPGEEILSAVRAAEQIGATVHLADRDIRTTLARTWGLMGFWSKIKLFFQLILSLGSGEEITEADIEEMKKMDVLEALLSEIGKNLPGVRRVLIDERDQYLAEKIRTAPGEKIVAVVGMGHVPGIKAHWDQPVDMNALEQRPAGGRIFRILKWGIPAAILLLIAAGFYRAGISAGTAMITWWVLANAVLAGLGAAVALAHPFTILSAVCAAPLTSLNPMIAAGWVSGLVQAFISKPKVRDFESLPEDIVSVKGFWTNKITRILLVVVFTNIGSSLGTFVAIPLMVRAFS